jgi:hypothetical protein
MTVNDVKDAQAGCRVRLIGVHIGILTLAALGSAAKAAVQPMRSALTAQTLPPAMPEAAAVVSELAAKSPPLDLPTLEQRLRDTRAIGVFTKLSIKNQVDDLLDEFRAFHRGEIHVRLTQLREKYELLIFKVITLLQDGDPSLAAAVLSSREAIWKVLTDPAAFKTL